PRELGLRAAWQALAGLPQGPDTFRGPLEAVRVVHEGAHAGFRPGVHPDQDAAAWAPVAVADVRGPQLPVVPQLHVPVPPPQDSMGPLPDGAGQLRAERVPAHLPG
ncbi:unnamed protein product, partial [Prorocentrum cordatum]